jgi:small nuclear ribonucleoprotein (snRNP)-like protein
MDNDQASFWLSQFIGKNLRIHASDGRVFGGQLKCTDKVSATMVVMWEELEVTSRRTATSY